MVSPSVYTSYCGSLAPIIDDFSKHMIATFGKSLHYIGTTTNLADKEAKIRDIDIMVVLSALSVGHIGYIWRIITKLRVKYNIYLDVRMYSIDQIVDESAIPLINKFLLRSFLVDKFGINPFLDCVIPDEDLKKECFKLILEQEKKIHLNIPRAAANPMQIKEIAHNVFDAIRAFLLLQGIPSVDKEKVCKLFVDKYNSFPEVTQIYEAYIDPGSVVSVANFITDSISIVKHVYYKALTKSLVDEVLLINTPSSVIPHPVDDYLSYDHNMPLGLVSIATFLCDNGISISILDSYAENLGVLATIDRIFSDGKLPKIIGLNASSPNINIVHILAAYIKRINSEVVIVCGGPHASLAVEHTLSTNDIDYAVIGEGEIPLLEIANAIFNGNREYIKSVKGACYQHKGRIYNIHSAIFTDLSILPLPNYSLLPLARYYSIKKRLYINATRGCAFNCIYCSVPKFCGRKVRELSAGRFFSQVKDIVDKYKPDEVQIVDDNFSHRNGDLIESFCKQIIATDFAIKWKCQVRADQLTAKLPALMQCAGCFEVDFGIESGNSDIQKYIRKNLNLAKTARTVESTSKQGIYTKAFFMLGFPGESYGQMADTINYAIELKSVGLKDVAFFPVMPFPGTKIAEITGRVVYQGAVMDEIDLYEKSFAANRMRKYSAKPEISLNKLFDPDQLRMLVKFSYQRFQFGVRVTDLQKEFTEFSDLESKSMYAV